jgi:hypothetical protein
VTDGCDSELRGDINLTFQLAEPLEMENGRDLIEMVVSAYETPDDEVTDDDNFDYSTTS